jgi:PPOX class probable F420-dependent enzyme
MDTGLRERFGTARVARLATVRPDGGPHVVPITFALLGETVYHAVDAKPKRTRALQRLENLGADPRASVLADAYEEDWTRLWWVRGDGRARILEAGPEFEAALAALAERYDPYRAAAPAGPVIALEVERWSGWDASA